MSTCSVCRESGHTRREHRVERPRPVPLPQVVVPPACRCGGRLVEDLAFGLQLAGVGVQRRRWVCLAGHSLYLPPLAERPEPPGPHAPRRRGPGLRP